MSKPNMKQKSLTELLHNVEAYLAQSELNGEPAQLYAPIIYSMEEGGKRLRPMLTLLACGIFGDEPEAAMPCAAAVEFFHNFTLLHDDIMDNAPIRRGKPSVFRKWNQNVAILSGDAMIVYAYRLLEKAPAHLLPQIFEVFNSTAMKVFEGQQYDMEFEGRSGVSTEGDIRMIDLETAVLRQRIWNISRALPMSWAWRSSCKMICWTATAPRHSSVRLSVAISSKAKRPS